MTPEPDRPAPHDRLSDWLHDLAGFGADADYLVGLGQEAYLADTPHGRLLRNAGERLLIKVATIVERLPDEFKAEYPDVEWSNINRMRNLVDHQDDKVNDDLMFVTLRRDIPALIKRLGLSACPPDRRRGPLARPRHTRTRTHYEQLMLLQ